MLVVWSLINKSLFLNFWLCCWKQGLTGQFQLPLPQLAFSQMIPESPLEERSEAACVTALSHPCVCTCHRAPSVCTTHHGKVWRYEPPLLSISKERRASEVWATIVFYISLWHGLSVPDKHKNIFRILECIWNMKEKTQIYLRFSRGLQKQKSSGKLPLVNNFYITEAVLLFVLII